MRVLVTGFEPFSRDDRPRPAINASSEAVRRMRAVDGLVRVTDIPVEWTAGPSEILHHAQDAQIVVLVGEIGSGEPPAYLRLEHSARNLAGDNALFHGEPGLLRSTVSDEHRSLICTRLAAAGIEAGPASDESCGNYLCNASYYHLLREAGERWVQFIHVRALRDEEGLSILARGLEIVVATLVELHH
jgi:pyrrolidone-carboxylate peptidase